MPSTIVPNFVILTLNTTLLYVANFSLLMPAKLIFWFNHTSICSYPILHGVEQWIFKSKLLCFGKHVTLDGADECV